VVARKSDQTRTYRRRVLCAWGHMHTRAHTHTHTHTLSLYPALAGPWRSCLRCHRVSAHMLCARAMTDFFTKDERRAPPGHCHAPWHEPLETLSKETLIATQIDCTPGRASTDSHGFWARTHTPTKRVQAFARLHAPSRLGNLPSLLRRHWLDAAGRRWGLSNPNTTACGVCLPCDRRMRLRVDRY
jgi:hypothetical protein